MLDVRLRDLDRHSEQRREHAERYSKGLRDIPGVVVPAAVPGRTHVHHIYAVRVSNREGLMNHLESNGIHSAIHYPVPVDLQPAYAGLGYGRGSFPVAERCADEFVPLPMFPELSSAQIDAVVGAVREFTCAGAASPSTTVDRASIQRLP